MALGRADNISKIDWRRQIKWQSSTFNIDPSLRRFCFLLFTLAAIHCSIYTPSFCCLLFFTRSPSYYVGATFMTGDLLFSNHSWKFIYTLVYYFYIKRPQKNAFLLRQPIEASSLCGSEYFCHGWCQTENVY